MSHYGYVSEQLLNGGLFPRRSHRGDRRGWRLRRREARSTRIRPVERDRIRGYVDVPAPGR